MQCANAQHVAWQFNDGELMAQFGDATTDWMVVESGTVVLLSPNKKFQLMQFEAGTSIGELGIVLTGIQGQFRNPQPVPDCLIRRLDGRRSCRRPGDRLVDPAS